jgi:hypothetical protein
VAVEPTVVDVTRADRTLTITVSAFDAGSGIKRVYPSVGLVGSLEGDEGDVYLDSDSPLRKVAGTAHRGTWRLEVRVSHCTGVLGGDYAGEVYVQDRADNADHEYVNFVIVNGNNPGSR